MTSITATTSHGSHPGLWGSDLAPSSRLSPISVLAADACSRQHNLERIPGELLLEIFKDLDLASVLTLAATCKRLRQLFTDHRGHIIFSILPSEPEIGPADGLFQTLAMRPSDLSIPWGTWLNKEIWFRRKLLCFGTQLPVRIPGDRTSPDLDLESKTNEIAIPGVVCFGDVEIDRILEISKVVRGWERLFPRFRFAHHPEQTRKLRPHEAARLRRALYHWIKYDYYFHGDCLPRPGPSEPLGSDERYNFVRMPDSGEASELADLWITVKSAVESLCPSSSAVRAGVESSVTEEQASGIAWGTTEHEHSMSVSTMLKLGPESLLYYIEHAHQYSKARLVAEILCERPCIESDTESLTAVISMVYRERYDHCLSRNAPAPPSPFSSPREPFGGILDWEEDGLESLRGSVKAGFGLRWLPDGDAEEDDGEEEQGDEEEAEEEEEGHGVSAGGLGF